MLALSARCLDTAFESDAAPRDDQSRTAPTAGRLVERQEALLFDRLLPALAERGLEIGRWADLDGGAQRQLTEVFDQTIFPVLTPLRLGPAHPALQLGSLDLQVGVTADDEETGERFFARVALPDFLPRVVEVSGHRRAFVAVEEIVKNQVDRLFPGASIDSRGAFRVTRSRRLGGIVPDHGGAGLLAPRGDAVRLECDAGLSDDALRLLLQALSLGEDAVYARRLPLDLGTADHLASAVARA